MKKVADVEKLKLLAEEYIRVSKDLKELKKEMNNLVADTDVEINEHLSEGGMVMYHKPPSKNKIDKSLLNELLFNIILNFNKDPEQAKIPSNLEIESQIKEKCQVIKEFKWKLTIKSK
ncbi:hypothetical protein RRG39_02670 [Mycoplasmopsis cynos]|uniref:hypothetical protein n=1 Tax=Mycoplasmopsis cynos TaxID=171284 RepID=UPI002AFDCA7D|nr:hypothetical protein [Mycoplasmopsis cynos]WQQ16656.1 hypothetical protein RRG39_02670 [Mycoplasmopsis cynos]